MKRVSIYGIWTMVSLVFTIVLLHLFGFEMENGIRDFYRSHICSCDTLRHRLFLNEDGIPLMNYYSTSGEYLGEQENPLEVCKKAREYFPKATQGNSEMLRRFRNCYLWILNHITEYETNATLYYDYPWLPYHISPPWHSAMTNASALVVMAKATLLPNVAIHSPELEDKLLNLFSVPVDSGGLCYPYPEGWWYEEYAHVSGDKPHVLNGMMHSLLDLHEFSIIRKNKKAALLFENGIAALHHRIHRYDLHGESAYDLHGLPAPESYQQLHIELMDSLLAIAPNQGMETLRYKWMNSPANKSYLILRLRQPNKTFFLLLASLFVFFLAIILVLTSYK